jgi:hypothetical protein
VAGGLHPVPRHQAVVQGFSHPMQPFGRACSTHRPRICPPAAPACCLLGAVLAWLLPHSLCVQVSRDGVSWEPGGPGAGCCTHAHAPGSLREGKMVRTSHAQRRQLGRQGPASHLLAT